MSWNWVKVLLPALYAWLIHSFWIGASVFILLTLVSAGAAWAFVFWTSENAIRNANWARNAIMVLAFIAVAVSGAKSVYWR